MTKNAGLCRGRLGMLIKITNSENCVQDFNLKILKFLLVFEPVTLIIIFKILTHTFSIPAKITNIFPFTDTKSQPKEILSLFPRKKRKNRHDDVYGTSIIFKPDKTHVVN